MKLVAFLTIVAMYLPVFAAQVKSAQIDPTGENILVEVVYGGGCEVHTFSLKLHGCLESMPVQCSAQLVDSSKPDFCEALVRRTVSLPLADYGLKDPYFQQGSLTIKGSAGSETTVQLP